MAEAYNLLIISVLLLAVSNAQVTYYQPEKSIVCPPADQVCDISLTVSTMTTLTAYRVNDGVRSSSGSELLVNANGEYDFLLGAPTEPTTRFQPIAGDGYTRRFLYVINDQFPAPAIIGYTDQTVRIRVTNRLIDESISMHWHGQHQVGTPYMDGAAYVTQCPILPNNDFLYEFKLFPEGTFWYHAHIGNQISNGMYGPLIVRPPDPEPTDYVDLLNDHTIMLNEWFTVNSKDWQQSPTPFLNPADSTQRFQPLPIHDGSEGGFSPFLGGLINGAGWLYTQDSATCTRLANTTLPLFNVTQGTKYRFRLIASQANVALRFSIQGHRFQVIASDGFDINMPDGSPDEVDYIILHAGERYDFILNANQAVDNFVMIAETLEVPSVLLDNGYCVKAHRAYAVLHYDGASQVLPDDFDDFDSYDPYSRCSQSQCYAINCPFGEYAASVSTTCINLNQLVSADPQPVPNTDVSEPVFLQFGFLNGALSINGRAFVFPPSPLLSQREDISDSMFCPYSQDPDDYGVTNCIHTYTATSETIELVFFVLGFSTRIFSAVHPVHIHGHHFHVLDVGYPEYNSDGTFSANELINTDISCGNHDFCAANVSWANGRPPPSQCEINNNCPRKDTVMVPAGGYVRVRIAKNNWGWWLLHCHIGSHFTLGMGLMIDATSAPNAVSPPENFPRCGMYQSYVSSGTATALANTYQYAMIGLAAASGFLLILLILVTMALICVCCCKRNGSEKSPEPKIPLSDISKYE